MDKIKLASMIDNLVESRKLYNELSDKIYAIAYGNLDDTPYNNIYQNSETFVRILLNETFPNHAEFIDEFFCSIILDLAQGDGARVEIDNKELWIVGAWGLFDILGQDKPIGYIDSDDKVYGLSLDI